MKKRKGVKYLVICESPSKARTLSKFLGRDFKVLASFGHVRDLPKSTLGFDPDNNFKPDYTISKDKFKIVKELKSYIGNDTIIYLAADDDREGEAIAWHLIPTLKIENHITKRVVFHEITKDAILHAIKHPRELDINLVNAQQARRILDRAVGYILSPLLWKKIKYGLSAGRVQSVTVRIIVDKEKEILAFNPEEYWKLNLDILSNPKFKAELHKIDNKVTKVKTETEATVIKNDCDNNEYTLENIISKNSHRNPPPPFTTSTIQQEASRKLGFGVKNTMSVAQKLYEGSINIPGHTGGIITYMRTDSMNLSKVATESAKKVIMQMYGKEYTIPYTRSYTTKSKGAQEAHEAIRPVDMSMKPSDIERHLSTQEFKLYSLIWKRTMATQMAQANVANTTYKISGGTDKKYEFVAKGTKILFQGFMKAYTEGSDDPNAVVDNSEKFLPNVTKGTVFKDAELTTEQHFTKPPPRYTEASLVKKMEQEGVGRPSTYASTISTILNREYVEKTEDKKLAPTLIGTIVNDYLVEHFSNIVDLNFTANIENELDKIAEGKMKWQDVMGKFYKDFIKNIDDKADSERVQYSESRILGKDKETGLDIIVKTGMYGSYISLGEPDKEKKFKPKVSPIPKGVKTEDITMKDAKEYMRVPRILGKTPNGDDIKVNIGRFGPFLQVKNSYYSIKKDAPYDVYTITLREAQDLIKTIDDEKVKSLWWSGDSDKHGEINIINGRFGPYIKRFGVAGGHSKANFKLPKDLTESAIRKLTIDKVVHIMENQPTPKKRGKRGK